MVRRRAFIRLAACAALGARAAVTSAAALTARPLRILMLGGTRFLGIHMTEYALARGHSVTLFNRGRTRAELFPALEHLHGDRDGKLDALRARKWDAVIDNSGYVPRHVRLSSALLAPSVGQYLFVSTISVYPNFAAPRTETSTVGTLNDPSIEKITEDTYGPLKALCEQEVEHAFAGRATVLRPGLIVGPEDGTDRFTYWPARAARGGELLAPGTPVDGVQFIDARDLAAFAVRTLEERTTGTFNVLSPPGRFTMGSLLDASIAAAMSLAKPDAAPRATWVSAPFLAAQKIEAWTDLPVWIPAVGEDAAAADTSAARAVKAGLAVRDLAGTARDTLAWHLSRPPAEREKLKAGLSAQRESAALKLWHESELGMRPDDPQASKF
jgi:2'-hydroxyisoflavone reductase